LIGTDPSIVKGFGLSCAHISHCFFRACVPLRQPISELCKPLYFTITVESVTSPHVPQIHRFRPQAQVPPLGVCLPHQRCGDSDLHARFRGPPRASPVRFQVSQPADRTSLGWARGVPLGECRFPGPTTRRLGRLRRESERSTPSVAAARRPCLVVVAATPNYLRQASQNLGKYKESISKAKPRNTVRLRYSFARPETLQNRCASAVCRALRGVFYLSDLSIFLSIHLVYLLYL
jgi:hypothetical protein